MLGWVGDSEAPASLPRLDTSSSHDNDRNSEPAVTPTPGGHNFWLFWWPELRAGSDTGLCGTCVLRLCPGTWWLRWSSSRQRGWRPVTRSRSQNNKSYSDTVALFPQCLEYDQSVLSRCRDLHFLTWLRTQTMDIMRVAMWHWIFEISLFVSSKHFIFKIVHRVDWVMFCIWYQSSLMFMLSL